jgi:hypothetical protein
MTRLTGTLHEDKYTFLIISRSVPVRMRSVSDKIMDKIKIHMFCSIDCFENLFVYEAMWKHFVESN